MRVCLALLLLTFPGAAQADQWKLDPSTTVTVQVPWQGTVVPVHFPKLSGTIDFDENNPAEARATITADPTAASTGVGVVDTLVRSEGYLDAAAHPAITFELKDLRQISKSSATVRGELTLRGQTRPVAFAAKVFRYGPDPAVPGRFAAGFDLSGSIDRTQFGSTAGLPEVGAVLPVAIHLLMVSN